MNGWDRLAIEALEQNRAPGKRICDADGMVLTRHDVGTGEVRPEGIYLTLALGQETQWNGTVTRCVVRAMRHLLDSVGTPARRVLVVGLGNRNILCDRLGTEAIDRLAPTECLKLTCPMVREQTGLDTADLVAAACHAAKADLVVSVDALVCHKPQYLMRSVELSNASFRPGGGVGLPQKALDRVTVGAPTLYIGVPMLSFVDPYVGTLCVTTQDVERQTAHIADTLAAALRQTFGAR